MYNVNCYKCDFHANSTFETKLKKCPVCGGEIFSYYDSEHYKEIQDKIENIPIPKKNFYKLEIDGCDLVFSELKDEDIIFCRDFAAYPIEKISQIGVIIEFDIDNDMFNMAMLAMSLELNDLPFNYKYRYLTENFSKEQINSLNIKYTAALREKYDAQIDKELENLQLKAEQRLMLLEELKMREIEINQEKGLN